jgi:hypothetical protein
MTDTWKRRIALLLAVGAALGLIVFGFARDSGREGTSNDAGGAVDSLIPAEDSEALSQSSIGIDLAAGYTGELSINSQPVPEDELVDDRQQYRILYQPSEDSALGVLPAGEVCVQAQVWPISEGRQAARAVHWCFNVT